MLQDAALVLPCLGQCGVPQAGKAALDGCAALKLMCCEVQHEHWPCLGQCFGQLASRDSTLAWLEVGVLRGAA